jgi:hypothetical protein
MPQLFAAILLKSAQRSARPFRKFRGGHAPLGAPDSPPSGPRREGEPHETRFRSDECGDATAVHRRILLDTRWRQIGLGVIRANDAGGVYAGQSVVILAAEFGLRR